MPPECNGHQRSASKLAKDVLLTAIRHQDEGEAPSEFVLAIQDAQDLGNTCQLHSIMKSAPSPLDPEARLSDRS